MGREPEFILISKPLAHPFEQEILLQDVTHTTVKLGIGKLSISLWLTSNIRQDTRGVVDSYRIAGERHMSNPNASFLGQIQSPRYRYFFWDTWE